MALYEKIREAQKPQEERIAALVTEGVGICLHAYQGRPKRNPATFDSLRGDDVNDCCNHLWDIIRRYTYNRYVNTNVSAYDAVELAIEMDYIADRVREMPTNGKRAERLPFIIKGFEGHAKKLRHAVDEHEAIAEKIREQHPRARLRPQGDERSPAGSERSNRMDLWARVAAVACDLIERFNPAGLPDRPNDYPVPGRREILVALKPISAMEGDNEFATACREAIDHILKGMYFEALHSLNRALESQ